MTNEPTEDDDEWTVWWNAREAALEEVLGRAEEVVATAPFPIYLGGSADVMFFRNHIEGVVNVTAGLTGLSGQEENRQGNYELMICHRDDDETGMRIISQLASYTLDNPINPGETMSIGDAAPEDSTITAFLFFDYARIRVLDQAAGLLLCLGITSEELKACRSGHRERVEKALRETQVYPYTIWHRESVV